MTHSISLKVLKNNFLANSQNHNSTVTNIKYKELFECNFLNKIYILLKGSLASPWKILLIVFCFLDTLLG